MWQPAVHEITLDVIMKLKQLVALLQEVPSEFPHPDYELEQYPTPCDLAAEILYTIEATFGSISDKAVCDLGCGPGMLSFGAAALGAASVLGIDIDVAALESARETAEDLEVSDSVDFLLMDVLQAVEAPHACPLRIDLGLRGDGCPEHGMFDTVITNPPFGTRRPGADVTFVRAGLALASPNGTVYSLHKSSTRAHMVRVAEAAGVGMAVVAQLRFTLPSTYVFHRKESVDIAVDLLRFVKGPEGATLAMKHDLIPPFVEEGEAGAASRPRHGIKKEERGRGRGRSGR